METVQANLEVANKAHFERFIVQKLPKNLSIYEFELLRLLRATRISHKPERFLFEYANDNIHLPINLLGLIVNGLQFLHDNVF